MTDNSVPRKTSRIPLLLAGIIAVFILFLAWSARQAATGGTDITDRDYYSKGLKYNSTMVEQRAASVIGWTLTAWIEERTLHTRLVDKENTSISAAAGILVIGNRMAASLPLTEKDPGHYVVTLPPEYSGELPVRIDFERQGARISRQLLLNIKP